jgi:polar amino acid transport system permease protein
MPLPSGLWASLGLLAYSPPGWGGALLRGLAATLEIAVGGYGIGLILGAGGAIGKLYGGPVTKDLLGLYTTLVRAGPELVLIVLLYYVGTDAINRLLLAMGIAGIDISGLAAGILVIGFVQGAYTTEVLRGAILSVPAGQIEAARSVGMPTTMLLRRIILPAMMPYATPGLSNLWLIAMKDTALLAVVGFSELTLVTRQAAGITKDYFFFFGVAGMLYLGLTLVSNVLIRLLEFRTRKWMPRFR